MKTKKLTFYVLLFLGLFLSSCVDDSNDEPDPIHDKKTLSAGASTSYTFTSVAFDTPADWVTGELGKRFLRGDGIYDNPRVSGNNVNGGLGNLYSGYACAGCHDGAGRTLSTLYTDGGTGHNGSSVFLVMFESDNQEFNDNYGGALHDQAIVGFEPEGILKVEYTEKSFSFPDGEEYKLLYPKYTITDWYTGEETDYKQSIRTPLRHVGMGMMLAVDREMIKSLAEKEYPESGVSGRVNYIDGQVGLVGHKANHIDLTVELSFASDMGVMNSRFPKASELINKNMTDSVEIEISDEDMADVDFYLHTLGVPARRNVNDPEVLRGEKLFVEATCDQCHVKTLRTQSEGATLIDGTKLPQLGNQEIHPFTDYLLHDMGDELGDDVTMGMAEGNEWRTAPLWGIGLQNTVNGHNSFLHDARARNFVEAIMWHGGEGAYSRDKFANMNKTDRDALVAYLKSL